MRRGVLVGVLVTMAILVGTAVPAHAEELTSGCTRDLRRFEGWSYYTPNGSVNEWYEMQYLLSGPDIGDKSNVNFWIHQDDAIAWAYQSPDDRRPWVRYVYPLPTPVSTFAHLNEYVRFEAIFDLRWASDPRCAARTQSI